MVKRLTIHSTNPNGEETKKKKVSKITVIVAWVLKPVKALELDFKCSGFTA